MSAVLAHSKETGATLKERNAEDATAGEDPPAEAQVDEWRAYLLEFDGAVPREFKETATGKGYFTQLTSNLYEVNFRDCVGRAIIAGICVHVRNRKLSDDQHAGMLADVTAQCAALVFDFDRPAGAVFQRDAQAEGPEPLFLRWAFLRQVLIRSTPDLKGILGIIRAEMHSRLQTVTTERALDQAIALGPAELVGLVARPRRWTSISETHHLSSTPIPQCTFKTLERRLIPEGVPQVRRHQTRDTPENRFVKHLLLRVIRETERIRTAIGSRGGPFLNPELSEEAERVGKTLRRFLQEPEWGDVGVMDRVPANSMVLQRREGYRQLFRLHSLWSAASRAVPLEKDFLNLVALKDVHTLYEYWCFFIVKGVLDRMFGEPQHQVLTRSDDVVEDLLEGLVLHYDCGAELWFNRTCSSNVGLHHSYSHNLIPDLLITHGGAGLVLDAKCKGQRDHQRFYGDETEGDITTVRDDDINKMHAYRDALQGVRGAYVLYPGQQSRMHQVPGGQLGDGVGAFRLRPGNDTSDVEELRTFLCEWLGRRQA